MISQTNTAHLDIILSEDPEGKLRDWIRDTVEGRVQLKHILARLDKHYDFVLIDTQGGVMMVWPGDEPFL